MKKILVGVISCLIVSSLFAQDNPKPASKKKINLKGRANDHFLLQFGYSDWVGRPDTIHVSGFSRSFNAYFMLDLPFKSDPRFSAAIGVGVGTDNIFFSKTYVGIKDVTTTLRFEDQSDTNHFKKNKLATATLEAPLEVRFSSHPATPNKSFKVAIGIKAGLLVNAHTKEKILQSSTGTTINSYIEKENSKRFFNSNRFVATIRVGYGVVSLFGTIQLNPLLKQTAGPSLLPATVGITLSGL